MIVSPKIKKKFLKELEKSGNIGVAAARIGIHRSTIYRWKKDDEEFSRKADEAELLGRENNNDIAEQALMLNVKDRKQPAIEYLLSHNSPRYRQPILPSLREFEDIFPGEGLMRYRRAMAIKRKAERMCGVPLRPGGAEISDTELEQYEGYIKKRYGSLWKEGNEDDKESWIEKAIDTEDSKSEKDKPPEAPPENQTSSNSSDLSSASPDKRPDNNT